MAIIAGFTPYDFLVPLHKDSRYEWAMTRQAGPWPDGMGIELWFTPPGVDDAPVVWPATLSGPDAYWDQPLADVRAVLHGRLTVARLFEVPAAGEPLIWMRGRVSVLT
jgi:hypothetical protein